MTTDKDDIKMQPPPCLTSTTTIAGSCNFVNNENISAKLINK